MTGATDASRASDTFDRDLSAAMARRVRARFRHCWHNAACAVHHLGPAAWYVEGWVVVGRADPYVIEHGWCEVHGRIVDPSYAPQVSPFEPPLAYFPGMRFRAAEAEAAFTRRQLPIAWSGSTQTYPQAFEVAWHHAAQRASQPPVAPTQVINCRSGQVDEFVGRPSKWQNPFHIGRDGSFEEVVAKFREWLIRKPQLLRDVRSLRGRVLGCHCPPRPCHGHVLAELANRANEAMRADDMSAAPPPPFAKPSQSDSAWRLPSVAG